MSVERIKALIGDLRRAVLEGPGTTPPPLRQSAATQAAAAGGHALGTTGALPAELAAYVDTVARHAYRVTDEQVAELLAAGHSEDAVFELTVSAALGAGLARFERGLAALEGEANATQARGA
jgi:alkylhydroperoxidase family enzyme